MLGQVGHGSYLPRTLKVPPPPQVRGEGGLIGEDHHLWSGGRVYRGKPPPQLRWGGGDLIEEDHQLRSKRRGVLV